MRPTPILLLLAVGCSTTTEDGPATDADADADTDADADADTDADSDADSDADADTPCASLQDAIAPDPIVDVQGVSLFDLDDLCYYLPSGQILLHDDYQLRFCDPNAMFDVAYTPVTLSASNAQLPTERFIGYFTFRTGSSDHYVVVETLRYGAGWYYGCNSDASGWTSSSGSTATTVVGEEMCLGKAELASTALDRVALDLGDSELCEVTLRNVSQYIP
ncbi:MAG: hypothetical protein H6738_25160 [Alphaproteobacteria bacterium]|nr:hypothetical protein [Alphaproteobacteria bacterium]